ncbi:MAG: VOC family protein [Gelidibacter sp.]|nr:VOC family protein [Gelidibacter sp.]
MKSSAQHITPCIWFDSDAEEAARFYTSIFKHSRIEHITKYPKVGQDIHRQEAGKVMTVEFYIENYKLLGLNGGPVFKKNPSVSFFVMCDTEAEEEQLWNHLLKDGQILMPLDCYDWSSKYGWVQDKFGLSWQLMLREGDESTPKISPSFLFMGPQRGHAEDAIRFYAEVFKISHIEGIAKYSKGEVAPEGYVKHAQFQLLGQTFMAMDAGMDGEFRFNEALSFMVFCKDQEEVDYYWETLSKNGSQQPCGWVKDQFGVSWQIIPSIWEQMIKDPDEEKTDRVFNAIWTMKKLDIEKLKHAYKG